MRKTPLKPGTKRLRRYTKPKPRKRTSFEFDRIYGSPARAKLMRERPCDICGREATMEEPNQNVHTETGGIGYKAGWETVLTGCDGCHRAIHWIGSIEKASEVLGKDLKAIAARLAVECPA